jgi:hypothetical protein
LALEEVAEADQLLLRHPAKEAAVVAAEDRLYSILL